MISLESLREGFALSVNGKRLLIHTRRAPCIGLGQVESPVRGLSAVPRLKRGSFSYLHACKIREQGPSFVSMQFEGRITADFRLEDGKLKIAFSGCSPEDNFLELRFQANPDERIYGLGERRAPLDFKGHCVPCWLDEHDALQDRDRRARSPSFGLDAASAFPLPRFISSQHYSCEVDCDSCVLFDFRHRTITTLQFCSIPRAILISAAPDLPGLLAVTGEKRRQPLLPDWAFEGAWLSFSGSPEDRDRKLKAALASGAAVSALCPDTAFYDGEADKDGGADSLEDTAGLLKIMRFSPEFPLGSTACREAKAGGFLVRAPEGGDYLVQTASGAMCLADLTNPRACDWLRERIRAALRAQKPAGVDACQRISLPADAGLCAPVDAGSERNRWAGRWISLVREAMTAAFGPGAVSCTADMAAASDAGVPSGNSLSGTSESAMPARGTCLLIGSAENVSTLGEVDLYRSSLACRPRSDSRGRLFDSVPAALSLGCSGVGFWHTEVEPGRGRPEVWRDAFLRSIEMSGFSPVFRVGDESAVKKAGGAGSVYGDPLCLSVIARFSVIHAALKQYHLAAAREYIEKGLPLIRPVSLHYESETELSHYDHQYLYGRDLLVAPAMGKERELTSLFLPSDNWVHFWSSRRFGGGKVIVDSPLGCPAVFYRASSPYAQLFDSIRRAARSL